MTRNQIALFSLFAVACSGKTQNTDIGKPSAFLVEFSTSTWVSGLSEKPGDIGVYVTDRAKYWQRVPSDFIDGLASDASLYDGVTESPLSVVSRNVEQAPDPENGAHLQPVEIVFGGDKLASSGWNVVTLKLTVPAESEGFLEEGLVHSVFRFDSAPAVVGVGLSGADSFSDVYSDITLNFSEPVQPAQGQDGVNPFVVEVEGAEVSCPFDEYTTWPSKEVFLRCNVTFSKAIKVSLKPGILQSAGGMPLLDVKGGEFTLSTIVQDLPRNLQSAPFWRPVPPGK